VLTSARADRVIVEFREGANVASFRRDMTVRREFRATFSGVATDVDPRTRSRIAALPYVKAIYPDKRVFALNDAAGDIGADRVWQLGTRGRGVSVAVIDSGIDYRHPALGGCFGAGCKVASGYDFVNDDADPMDDNKHGTHVAGIIAADSPELMGVAPDATLIAYKVLDASGSGWESDVIAAIERTADPNGDGKTNDHAAIATSPSARSEVPTTPSRAPSIAQLLPASSSSSPPEMPPTTTRS